MKTFVDISGVEYGDDVGVFWQAREAACGKLFVDGIEIP
ncbi:hypothetical protein ES707_15910 [subsurface metagenome]